MGVVKQADFIQSAIPKKRKRMKFAYGLVLGLLAFTQAKPPPPGGYGGGKLENNYGYGGGKLENNDGYGGGKLENNDGGYGGGKLQIGRLKMWDQDDDSELCTEEDIKERNCRTEYCPDMGRNCCSCYPDKKVKLKHTPPTYSL